VEPNETILVSGRIVAEFEDDATQFLAGEAEYVCGPETTAVVPATASAPPTNGVAQEKPG
jgi:hypothetical protein